MQRRLVLIPLLAATLAGCGAQAEDSSLDEFPGDERAVAEQVEELQTAGERRQPEDICANILARSLVQEIETAGGDCVTEMRKAIEDADDYDLEVRDVTITGETATAEVARPDGATETMEFAREDNQWRATALSGG
jgi:hypothetical protein